MFAQLVGLPGCGKSSLAAQLAVRHPERIAHVEVQHERIAGLLRRRPWLTLTALSRLAPVAVAAIACGRGVGSLRDRLAPLASLLNLMVRYRELQTHDRADRILIFDEFVHQRVLGLFAFSPDPISRSGLRWSLLWLRGYDAIPVYLPLAAAEAEKRIEARDAGWPPRWRSLRPELRSSLLARQQSALEELFLFAPGGTLIPATSTLEDTADEVFAFLERATREPGPRPRVGHFAFNLSSYSGAARQAYSLARQLEGVDSILFDVERGRRAARIERIEGSSLRVVRLPGNPLRALLAIIDASLTHRLQIFHLHGLVGAGLLSGWLLRRKLLLKTTLLGDDDLESLSTRLLGPIWLWLARRAQLNIAPSTAIAERNRRHLPEWRIRRIPNGVSVAEAPAARPTPRSEPIFCVVGLVCERKRTHLAIEKFLAAYGDDESARLHVVGPFGDQPGLDEGGQAYLERCQRLIPDEQADRVVFTGALAREEVQSIYESSLALLCFSELEGMPNVLLEAMAANCVPVTTEIAGVAREVIVDPSCGFVIEAGAPLPALADLVVCSQALGPRRRVEEAFALERIAEEYRVLYHELIDVD